MFERLWIQPAAGDAGGALGAAFAAHHMYFGQPRVKPVGMDAMQGAYLGPEYSDLDVQIMARKFGAKWERFDTFGGLCEEVADRLANGCVVGWHQGRMEWGPRALGNRSILADPRDPEMQKRLNLKIKYREGFRPFAPSVLIEDASSFFELDGASPYMLLVSDVQATHRLPRPEGYAELSPREKLYCLRSDVQPITHLDWSARVQTVHQETNHRYWTLINAFKRKTGYGLVVNTSFNVRGEPIVCTPEDAFRCFMATEIDLLVVGDALFRKESQPDWNNRDKWQRLFELD
jgi:carbamoyltransferase